MYTSIFIDKLKASGFEQKEAVVYSYLLEYGGGYPSQIADKTQINRVTVYKILTTLCVQGVVAEVEKRKKLYYYPESVSKFIRVTKQKVTLAEDAYEKALKLMPEIEGLLQSHDGKPRVTFYEGKDRVIEAYMTQVEGKGSYELCAFASTDHLKSFLPWKKFREYIKLKEKYHITARGIIPDTSINKKFLDDTHMGIKEKYKPIIRYVSKDIFPFKGEIVMYKNTKILFVKFDEVNPIAVIIEDQMIHNMMKMIFELAWATAKKLDS